jgi:hypothetical protein
VSSPFGDYAPPPPNYGRPAWAPSPTPPRAGSGRVVVLFVGALILLALIAAVVVFLGKPAPPVAPCAPAQPCAPLPSLPVVGSSPGPGATPRPQSSPGSVPLPTPGGPVVPQPSSDAPVALSGTPYTDSSLGYSFEYNSDAFSLGDTSAGSAVLNGQAFDAQVWVDAKTADTSPSAMIQSELADIDNFLIARVADPDTYDALLGPSIGFVPGDGGVWSGTLVGRDGNPVAPGGVTIVSATDGRITVAVVVIVGTPDARQGNDTQQHDVRTAADDILKTFQWSAP